jgi:hypothetical protein
MQGDPIYLQPPATRYRIRSDPSVPLTAGAAGGGRQWLSVSGCLLEFDAGGRLASATEDPGGEAGRGRHEAAIDVLRVWLPGRRLGISDFPLGCLGLPPDPARLSDEDWQLLRESDWADGRMFTLQLGEGKGELWIDRDGTVHLLSR